MLLLIFQNGIPDYAQWGIAGAIVFLVLIFLGFLLRALPSWKEVKLAEISVREKEAESRAAQATSFGLLSDALKSMSDVLNNVAVEQRQATENIRLSQRVSAEATARTEDTVNLLVESVGDISVRIEHLERLIAHK